MAELNDHTYEQVTALCEQGDELIRAYALSEEEMWAGEDPRYLDFLATVCEDIENYSRKH